MIHDVDILRDDGARSGSPEGGTPECADQTWQATDEAPGSLTGDTLLGDDLLGEGSLLSGRYRIGEQIGRGGMGRVYSGEHVGLGRPVAVKVLACAGGGGVVAARRFAAEGRATAAISHPGIVDVLDSGELADGRLFLVMERLKGQTLAAAFDERAPLPWREACSLLAEVANALAAAHRAGLIHRDLKPSNIMLCDDGERLRPKILDFGIAADMSQELDLRMTRPGQLLGTPLYMAPEQVDSLVPTPQMDIYALGCVLYHALSGEAPFAREDPFALIARKRQAPAPSIASERDDLPPALVSLVDRCLTREPAERLPSAAALESELRSILGDPIIGPRPRRRSAPWYLGLGSVAFLVVVASVYAGVGREPAETSDVAAGAGEDAVAEGARLSSELARVGPRADLMAAPRPTAAVIEPARGAEVEAALPRGAVSSSVAGGGGELSENQSSGAADGAPPADKRGRADTRSPPRKSPDRARCELSRQSAVESRRSYDWPGVIRHTADARCWSDAVERAGLRVKAHLEGGDYRKCIAEGEGFSDRKILSMVTICRRRTGS